VQINKPYRVSHRLHGFDYSLPEAYYATICTFQKQCIFGVVRSGKVCLNHSGEIVRKEWLRTPELRPGVQLGEFVVMPNHIHGIIVIEEGVPIEPGQGSLSAIVGNFKGAVTKRIRQLLNRPRFQLWQRNYYDHIIRDNDDWERIQAYILDNPINWSSDPENPLV
jgi:REP element-mobilizing transposase RayT